MQCTMSALFMPLTIEDNNFPNVFLLDLNDQIQYMFSAVLLLQVHFGGLGSGGHTHNTILSIKLSICNENQRKFLVFLPENI